jgi:gamma-glutamyltranspeptidase
MHHQHLPDEIRVEAGAIDRVTEQALIAAKHAVKWPHLPREFGYVTAIVRTPTGWDGAADPRGGGGAAGD